MWGGTPYRALSERLKIRNVAKDGIQKPKHNVAASSNRAM